MGYVILTPLIYSTIVNLSEQQLNLSTLLKDKVITHKMY